MTLLSDRLATAIIWIERWGFNPIVEAVLASPLHRLLSWRFAVITWTGQESGRQYTTPVVYRQSTGDTIVLFSSNEHNNWWKNFRGVTR